MKSQCSSISSYMPWVEATALKSTPALANKVVSLISVDTTLSSRRKIFSHEMTLPPHINHTHITHHIPTHIKHALHTIHTLHTCTERTKTNNNINNSNNVIEYPIYTNLRHTHMPLSLHRISYIYTSETHILIFVQ